MHLLALNTLKMHLLLWLHPGPNWRSSEDPS